MSLAKQYNELKRRFEKTLYTNPRFYHWLKDLGFTTITPVYDDPQYWSQDIDFLVNHDYSLEVKVRQRDWNDMVVETKSNLEADTPGWAIQSKADFLAYIYYVNKRILPKSFICSMYALKNWFYMNKSRFQRKLAPNPPINPVYHTEFYVVPLNLLPTNLVIR